MKSLAVRRNDRGGHLIRTTATGYTIDTGVDITHHCITIHSRKCRYLQKRLANVRWYRPLRES